MTISLVAWWVGAVKALPGSQYGIFQVTIEELMPLIVSMTCLVLLGVVKCKSFATIRFDVSHSVTEIISNWCRCACAFAFALRVSFAFALGIWWGGDKRRRVGVDSLANKPIRVEVVPKECSLCACYLVFHLYLSLRIA